MACAKCQPKIDKLESDAQEYRELASEEFAKARDPDLAGFKGRDQD